jgi:hypothetical protein
LRPSGAAGKLERIGSSAEGAPNHLSRFATGVWAECGPVSVEHGRTSAAGIPHRRPSCRERLGSEPIDPTHDLGEQGSGQRRLGQLEDDVASMAHDPCSDLDQFSRSVVSDQCSTSSEGQRAHEVGEVVGERVKLEPHRVVPEGVAG